MICHDKVAGEVAVLSVGTGLAGLLAAVFAVVPFSPAAPRGLCLALALVAFTIAATLRRVRSLAPAWVRHGVVVVATAAVSTLVAASGSPAGPGVTAYGFIWIAIHSATFHGRRALRRHLAGIGAGLAVGLVVSEAPSAVHTWVFVMSTVGVVGVVLNLTVERLRTEASEDPLTRTATRRAFLRAAQRVLLRAGHRGEQVTLVLVDLDDFTQVNDAGGHSAGDALLEASARGWRDVLRRGDVLGRIGGDEFAVLLPGTDEATARTVVRRMREHSPAAWSAGVATWTGESLEDLLRCADADLYAAKARRPQRPAVHEQLR